ncbi:MAG: hypothetical protein R3261_02095, partial [Alphaproteobacteria bacterium]|nr:hypothetical protein [Alphaproteobacteria bacterium]
LCDQIAKNGDACGVENIASSAAHSIFVTDMTDQLVVVEAKGSRLLERISRGCSLDFESGKFIERGSARSLFGQVNVIFNRMAENHFYLILDCSLINHFWEWLTQET